MDTKEIKSSENYNEDHLLVITDEQKEILKNYIPDFEDFTTIRDLLFVLDDVMLDSLDENEEGTTETVAIAKLYDQIYAKSKEKILNNSETKIARHKNGFVCCSVRYNASTVVTNSNYFMVAIKNEDDIVNIIQQYFN